MKTSEKRKWKKLGRIFDPEVELKGTGLRGALMPTVVSLGGDHSIVKVYYCPRDKNNRSEVHCFKLNLNDPFMLLERSDGPVLSPGDIGTFDDSGITIGSYVGTPDSGSLYYTGWNLTVTVPMNNSIGAAQLSENGNFKRMGRGPIMTRSLQEPFSCASPFVLREEDRYRMWYASMDDWKEEEGEPKHYYNIKYAESGDGILWEREGRVAIDYEGDDEYAFGRPFVMREDGIYKMWYAYRGDYYVIGYAESSDGIVWKRKDDHAGITISESGWDSEMIEYPAIHDSCGKRYMFYNGNGYGITGIGLAVLDR
ncbi:MAG: hypothetical protein AAF357_08765 [Verrucomicrobiota bacterium]